MAPIFSTLAAKILHNTACFANKNTPPPDDDSNPELALFTITELKTPQVSITALRIRPKRRKSGAPASDSTVHPCSTPQLTGSDTVGTGAGDLHSEKSDFSGRFRDCEATRTALQLKKEQSKATKHARERPAPLTFQHTNTRKRSDSQL